MLRKGAEVLVRSWWVSSLLCMSLLGSPRIELQGVPSSLSDEVTDLLAPLNDTDENEPALVRAQADVASESVKKFVVSKGYLEAKVWTQMVGKTIQLHMELGPQYRVSFIHWDVIGGVAGEETAKRLLETASLGKEDQPLDLTVLRQKQTEAVRLLRMHGFAFAEGERPHVHADAQHHQVSVTLPIRVGPQVTWGPTEIMGLERVKPELVQQQLCWCLGTPYNLEQVESSRDRLLRLGLFNSVQIRAEPREDNGPVAMTVDVSERKPRTISLGVSYATTEGFGAIGEWEHRNLWGMGEKLSIDAILAQRIQEFTLTGRTPLCHRTDLHGVGYAVVRRKHVISFLEQSADLVALVEWEYARNSLLSAGGKIEGLTTRDSPENGQDILASIPIYFLWSSAGDVFDPQQGVRFEARAAPTAAKGQPSSLFLPMRFAASGYLGLGKATLAARVVLGSIVGAALDDIPLPKRFFEGSAGGLRGYAYETVSPLNQCGIPIGGRSLLMGNFELRAPVSKNIELVPFVDIGNVFADTFPDFNIPPLVAVGGGIRYKTIVGPLRLDVAVPLNRRPDLDKPFSIYFSVGQSF